MYVWDDEWLTQRTEAPIEHNVPIVDPHHHLWAHQGMGRYLLSELHADTSAGHNVESTVFVECQWGYRSDGPEQLRPVGETETIAAIAADSVGHGAEIKGIVSFADLTLGDAVQDVLDAHVVAGRGRFKGIRHPTAFDDDRRVRPRPHTRPQAGVMGDPTFRRGVQRLAASGLSFDVWLYHPQIHELTDLARAVPECSFVLDHLGAPLGIGRYEGKRNEILERWRIDVAELATCPNVAMKLGGIGMVMYGLQFQNRAEPPSSQELADAWGGPISHAIEQFGVDRCMFESNFPADKMSCSYVTVWNAFKRMVSGASVAEKTALLHGTATQFYRL